MKTNQRAQPPQATGGEGGGRASSTATQHQQPALAVAASGSRAKGVKVDPSRKVKEEESRRLEALLGDCGKAIDSMLAHSKQEEVITKAAKSFAQCEKSCTKTERMLHQMQADLNQLRAHRKRDLASSTAKVPKLVEKYKELPSVSGEVWEPSRGFQYLK